MVLSSRTRAFACTLGATPCAEKTTVLPSGTSVSSSTKIAPRPRSSSTTCLLWTISLRTYTGPPCSSSARSTVWTARSTPAQYPRGAASSSFSGVLVIRSECREQGPGRLAAGVQARLRDGRQVVAGLVVAGEGPVDQVDRADSLAHERQVVVDDRRLRLGGEERPH